VIIHLYYYDDQESDKIASFPELQNKSQVDLISKDLKDDKYLRGVVEINGFTINTDIALTDKQKQDGLSIKYSMNENEGMLFIFDEPKEQSFWMKGMKFPIDIIWIDESLSIVHIEKGLKPCESLISCPSYRPTSEALYVLETISGFAEKHDLKIGNKINFQMLP
jgi:uncharacterized membrane protein (UPF0127 family)